MSTKCAIRGGGGGGNSFVLLLGKSAVFPHSLYGVTLALVISGDGVA